METGETRPPYTAIALREGWEFRSPAGRWEKVDRVVDDPGSFFTRVWTDKSGTFGWMLASSRAVHAVPPRASDEPIQLRLLDPGRPVAERMSIVLAYADAKFPWSDYEEMPAVATFRGRGLGWEVAHRPDGAGELLTEPFPDKLHAKRRLMHLMRQYALLLAIPIGNDLGRD